MKKEELKGFVRATVFVAVIMVMSISLNAQNMYTVTHLAIGDEPWEKVVGVIEAQGYLMEVNCQGIDSKVVVTPNTFREGNTSVDETPYEMWDAMLVSNVKKRTVIPILLIKYYYQESIVFTMINQIDSVDVLHYQSILVN